MKRLIMRAKFFSRNLVTILIALVGAHVTAKGIALVKYGYHGIVIKSVSLTDEQSAADKK